MIEEGEEDAEGNNDKKVEADPQQDTSVHKANKRFTRYLMLTKIIDEKVGIHSVNENHMYYRGSGAGRPMPGVNPATYGGGEVSNSGGGGVMPPRKFGPKN